METLKSSGAQTLLGQQMHEEVRPTSMQLLGCSAALIQIKWYNGDTDVDSARVTVSDAEIVQLCSPDLKQMI